MDLGALAASEADTAVLVGVLLRRRVHAHPGVDICVLAIDVIKVAQACMHYIIRNVTPSHCT